MARTFAVVQNTDVVAPGTPPMPQSGGVASIWIYPNYSDTNTFRFFFSLRDGSNDRLELYRSSTNVLTAMYDTAGALNAATTTALPTAGAWNHLLMEWATGPSGFVRGWLNGAAFTSQVSGLVTAWTNTAAVLAIGNAGNNTTNPPGLSFSSGCHEAEFAWWSGVTFSTSGTVAGPAIAALAGRARPRRIAPANLQMYLPLWGLASPEPDLVAGGASGAVTGTTVPGVHAPVSLFTPRWPSAPAGVGATSASFTVAPATIPANHAGAITLTIAGTATNFTSGSTVAVTNSVTGTTTVTKGTWTAISATSATLTVTTGAGAGTYAITVDGTASGSLTVGAASFTLSPNAGNVGVTQVVTATGTGTVWTQETAATLFSKTGGTGSSLSSISVLSDTLATFSLTNGSAVATITVTDATTGDTASFSVQSGPVTIPVTDTNLFFSPDSYSNGAGALLSNNVKVGSTFIRLTAQGSGFRAGLGGTSATLNFALNGVAGANLPTFAWRVDDGPWVTASPTAGATTLSLASGLAAGTHQYAFRIITVSTSIDTWNQSVTPFVGVDVSGITIDAGGASAAPAGTNAVRPRRALFVGDSNVQGESTGVGNGNDARASWVVAAAEALGAEAGWAGFGGSAYSAATSDGTNVPACDGIVLNYAAGRPRSWSNAFDYIFLCHGAKDILAQASAATVQHSLYSIGAAGEILPDLRGAAGASAWIFVVVPVCRGQLSDGSILTALSNAANAYAAATGDARVKVLDLGVDLSAGFSPLAISGAGAWSTVDDVHMHGVYTHPRHAAAVVQGVQQAIGGAASQAFAPIGCAFIRGV